MSPRPPTRLDRNVVDLLCQPWQGVGIPRESLFRMPAGKMWTVGRSPLPECDGGTTGMSDDGLPSPERASTRWRPHYLDAEGLQFLESCIQIVDSNADGIERIWLRTGASLDHLEQGIAHAHVRDGPALLQIKAKGRREEFDAPSHVFDGVLDVADVVDFDHVSPPA